MLQVCLCSLNEQPEAWLGPECQALREMEVGWGLRLGSEVLPTETRPLSQGRALDVGPDWVLDTLPTQDPLLLAWAWTPEIEGGAWDLMPSCQN